MKANPWPIAVARGAVILYQAGVTPSNIAKALRVSRPVVEKILKLRKGEQQMTAANPRCSRCGHLMRRHNPVGCETCSCNPRRNPKRKRRTVRRTTRR